MLILILLLSILTYSCTADDSVPIKKENKNVMKSTTDTIGLPSAPNPH
ncbi:hypothetical protein OX284_005315 [Flavobacterium sp. SUN046]|nr:hypothetical protein [Flavobacterium sp. SUN046]MEC4048837.1 hypothetical protein [Flavobacterium sp. SUN046]